MSHNADHTRLVDGKSLDGRWESNGCAHSNYEDPSHWYSLELDAPRTVTKVQIARRRDVADQGKNVKITIGPSKEYDAGEPLCRPEIPVLDGGWGGGMIDYPCTGDLKQGKYVKLSKAGGTFVICEVKIFVLSEETTTTALTPYDRTGWTAAASCECLA